jgi:AbrB family looped-hinge helix DNA binding protein
MNTVTISSKYQVVIPRKIREQFNLKPGQKIMFISYKNTLRVVIVPPIEVSIATRSEKRKVAMADSIILATTLAFDATLWTQGRDFEDIAGVQYIA